jgi:hypothetical protein
MTKFSWRCPFCQHHATITEKEYSSGRHEFGDQSKYGYQAIRTIAVVCPNEQCREYTLIATLHDHRDTGGSVWVDLPEKQTWNLIPAADVKVFPNYVPAAVLADYREASVIRELSPKASATLARRCLQGMIRDFWGVKPGRLVDEIEAIRERVDPAAWQGIDAVRRIGNIGAHMEKDIDVIVDVDPSEAELLIGLIETLIADWYVAREERRVRIEKIVAAAESKRDKSKS